MLDRIRVWLGGLRERPESQEEADRLSAVIDRAATSGDSEDHAVTAILKAAGARPLAPDMGRRTWRRLEQDLFPSPVARPLLSLPYRDRGGPARPWGRVHRAALVVGVAAVGVGTYGLWNAPYARGRALVNGSESAWSRLKNYRAAVQFISRVPGFQVQWSGTEYYSTPGQMRLEMDSVGIPTVIIMDGNSGAVESPVPVANVPAFRFVARTMRVDQLMQQLQDASSLRSEGSDQVVGQPCEVVRFRLRDGSRTDGPHVDRGRVWISDDLQLPLQVEMYLPDGSIATAYRFTRLLPNVSMGRSLFHIPADALNSDTPVTVRRAVMRVEMQSLSIER